MFLFLFLLFTLVSFSCFFLFFCFVFGLHCFEVDDLLFCFVLNAAVSLFQVNIKRTEKNDIFG